MDLSIYLYLFHLFIVYGTRPKTEPHLIQIFMSVCERFWPFMKIRTVLKRQNNLKTNKTILKRQNNLKKTKQS